MRPTVIRESRYREDWESLVSGKAIFVPLVDYTTTHRKHAALNGRAVKNGFILKQHKLEDGYVFWLEAKHGHPTQKG